jgi:hypothetical protein
MITQYNINISTYTIYIKYLYLFMFTYTGRALSMITQYDVELVHAIEEFTGMYVCMYVC